ncbi:hypothetical protein ES703_51200 [subsurface metagenome]
MWKITYTNGMNLLEEVGVISPHKIYILLAGLYGMEILPIYMRMMEKN